MISKLRNLDHTGLLGEQETVALLQGDTVTGKWHISSTILLVLPIELIDIPRVLVIGGETGGVGGLGDLAINNLLQGVDALAVRAEGVLEV